jgi:hypothetical protein
LRAAVTHHRDKARRQQYDCGDSCNFDRGHTDSMYSV